MAAAWFPSVLQDASSRFLTLPFVPRGLKVGVNMATGLHLLALPDELLTRVLVGVNRDDHDAAAAACGAFRAVIRGPRFLRLRREFGFSERGIVLVSSRRGLQQDESIDGLIEIRMANGDDEVRRS